MRRWLALSLLTVVLAACGEAPSQQAEHVGSLAAEGALVARGASEPRGTTEAFTRMHAGELASSARSLAKSAPPRVARLANDVADTLDLLADAAGDPALARRLEQRLRRAAHDAEQLAKAS